ncbi:MAG: HesA/MoeB/ThiF family protein [Bacteroidota bacterium]
MFNPSERERYSRHFILEGFGEDAQQKLKEARVLVIGAGGLGCPALLYLAAAGVGTIGIADGDHVSLSNLQRQVLYGFDDIATNKAKAAARKLSLNNHEIEIRAIQEFINVNNAVDLISEYDLVIDGSDNFSTRYLVNDTCVMLGKPLVYGAIFKFSGQLSVFNYQNGPTYRCLYPEAPAEGEMPGCGEIGVLGVLPGIIGTWQAAEAIKVICGTGEVLSGKLMTLDLTGNEVQYFSFAANPQNRIITQLEAQEYSCEINIRELGWGELLLLRSTQQVRLIDVREEEEYARQNIGAENIPLDHFKKRVKEFSTSETLVIHCQSGQRAKKAIEALPEGVNAYLLKDVKWNWS